MLRLYHVFPREDCARARHRGQVTALIMGEASAQTSCRRPSWRRARLTPGACARRTKIDRGQKKMEKFAVEILQVCV